MQCLLSGVTLLLVELPYSRIWLNVRGRRESRACVPYQNPQSCRHMYTVVLVSRNIAILSIRVLVWRTCCVDCMPCIGRSPVTRTILTLRGMWRSVYAGESPRSLRIISAAEVAREYIYGYIHMPWKLYHSF